MRGEIISLDLSEEEYKKVKKAALLYYRDHKPTAEEKKGLLPWYYFKKASFSFTDEGKMAMFTIKTLREALDQYEDVQ